VVVLYRGRIVDELDGPTATEESMLVAAHGLETAGLEARS
jgi:hypothetical protein